MFHIAMQASGSEYIEPEPAELGAEMDDLFGNDEDVEAGQVDG